MTTQRGVGNGAGEKSPAPVLWPKADWKWFGNVGHFIAGSSCQFHLCTVVGPWLVSTIGEYWPDREVRAITARSRGIEITGRGDLWDADYMEKIGWGEVGLNRQYETMVFVAGKPCTVPECRCGIPSISGEERDFAGYNERRHATVGHRRFCDRWSRVPEHARVERILVPR